MNKTMTHREVAAELEGASGDEAADSGTGLISSTRVLDALRETHVEDDHEVCDPGGASAAIRMKGVLLTQHPLVHRIQILLSR